MTRAFPLQGPASTESSDVKPFTASFVVVLLVTSSVLLLFLFFFYKYMYYVVVVFFGFAGFISESIWNNR